MSIKSIRFNKETWDLSRKPCVYKFIGLERVLYVGFSSKGLSRVFAPSGNHEIRRVAQENCVSVQVEFFETAEQAQRMETDEIHRLHPIGQSCYCNYEAKTPKARGLQVEKYLRQADALVEKFGGLPETGWMKRNGFSSLASYIYLNPDSFQNYKRLREECKIPELGERLLQELGL